MSTITQLTTRPSPLLLSDDDTLAREDGDPALERVTVTSCKGFEVMFDQPILAPFRRGWVGDVGSVDGIAITSVEQRWNGRVHILERQAFFEVGQEVTVTIDREHRKLIADTHAGVAVVEALYEAYGVVVLAPEVGAGLGWILTAGPAPVVDLEALAKFEIPLHCSPFQDGRMTVACGTLQIETYDAPIAKDTGALAGAVVRALKTFAGGPYVTEIDLPDRKGVVA